MTGRDRDWLQDFVRLGARTEKDGISQDNVTRQEDTILRALDILDHDPGVVLADEVGMGKTFEALGVAAALHSRNPGKHRTVIVTPGPDLNRKWLKELHRFREMYGGWGELHEATSLAELIERARTSSVTVVPVNIFQTGRGGAEQAAMIALFCRWKQLHGHTTNAIFSRFRGGELRRKDVADERFLGSYEYERLEPHLARAFGTTRSQGLTQLYEEYGLDAFGEQNSRVLKKRLYRARFELVRALMPRVGLLVVDEAHKLKSSDALRTRGVRTVFRRRFDKAAFLTATPFQLDVSELERIFALFAYARKAPTDLMDRVGELLTDIGEYQRAYDAFHIDWQALDPADAAAFSAQYDADPMALAESADPTTRLLLDHIRGLRTLKDDRIEPGLRRWMIRSLKEGKREYRAHHRRVLDLDGADALPFLLHERLIAEHFRVGDPTHKAAAQVNIASSHGAAAKGALLVTGTDARDTGHAYRALLRGILDPAGVGNGGALAHPKVEHVATDALNAALAGEKTLIFCTRTETLRELRTALNARWRAHVEGLWRATFPDAEDVFDPPGEEGRVGRGMQTRVRERFHRPQDALYLALREPYLRLVSGATQWAQDHLGAVAERATALLPLVALGKTAAENLDYRTAKRCVERAALELFLERAASKLPESCAALRLLDDAFLSRGFDLALDPLEDDRPGDTAPQWTISESTARTVLQHAGALWAPHQALLGQLDPRERVAVVEQTARHLTRQPILFLPELLAQARAANVTADPLDSHALLAFLPRFFTTLVGRSWSSRVQTFLEYFVTRDAQQRQDLLEGPLQTGELARDTSDGERRERLREAFNTPFHPMVLVANEVMQEGLDLHKQCCRVVHHDLAWNPAQLEQRVGRVDRLGSRTEQLRKQDPRAKLDVHYPLLEQTIDVRLYEVVKTRERWLEFLLGAAPRPDAHVTHDSPPAVPPPERLAHELKVHLAPR